jgi:hypothetical protein
MRCCIDPLRRSAKRAEFGISIRLLPGKRAEFPCFKVAGVLPLKIAIDHRLVSACCLLATLGMVSGCGENPPTSAPGATPSLISSPTADPTAGWVTYRSSKGQFSFKHPAGWYMSAEGDSGGLVSVGMGVRHPLGPLDSVTDIGAGSWSVTQNLDASCFLLKNVTNSQTVIVSGVTGSRKTGTLTECQGGQSASATQYEFTTNGRRYLFSYTARPDAVPLSDFDLMVVNTVSFSS